MSVIDVRCRSKAAPHFSRDRLLSDKDKTPAAIPLGARPLGHWERI